MATQLDLQEQEQLDALKAFWNKQGNLITWTLVLALALFAAWRGWEWWTNEQSGKASGLYEELDRAAATGDAERTGRIFNDLKDRYPGTAFAAQGGLLAARIQTDKGQADAAKASLTWVAEKASEDELRTIARLRLAALQADGKQFDEALKTLDGARADAFAALVADRRGDVLLAQGKKAEAVAAWQQAYKAMDDKTDYRRLVDAKLTAYGAPPAASVTASGAASAAASGAGK